MAYVTTLLSAVIAVIGIVVASIYSQRTTLLSRQQEFDLAKAQRQEEYELARGKAELEQRRACYVALNVAIRRHRAAINDLLFDLREGEVGDDVRAELEDSRRLYIERHAEAQMSLPGNVLEAAGAVRGHLSSWYSMAKRLETGATREGDSLDAAFDYSDRYWSRTQYMRSLMRSDLGIPDAGTEFKRDIDSDVPGSERDAS